MWASIPGDCAAEPSGWPTNEKWEGSAPNLLSSTFKILQNLMVRPGSTACPVPEASRFSGFHQSSVRALLFSSPVVSTAKDVSFFIQVLSQNVTSLCIGAIAASLSAKSRTGACPGDVFFGGIANRALSGIHTCKWDIILPLD